jgi:toxin ParE1/3/4
LGSGQSQDQQAPLTPEFLLRPEAEQDVREAYDWYEDQAEGLGEEFLRSLDATFALIQRHPMASAVIHRQVRRALTRRFPYGVFYVTEDERTVILAVLHMRQDPSVWPVG